MNSNGEFTRAEERGRKEERKKKKIAKIVSSSKTFDEKRKKLKGKADRKFEKSKDRKACQRRWYLIMWCHY